MEKAKPTPEQKLENMKKRVNKYEHRLALKHDLIRMRDRITPQIKEPALILIFTKLLEDVQEII